MLSLNVYKQTDRVIVQYYDSGKKDAVCCPDCGWEGRTRTETCTWENGCVELVCPHCSIPLAMISSRMPSYDVADRVF